MYQSLYWSSVYQAHCVPVLLCTRPIVYQTVLLCTSPIVYQSLYRSTVHQSHC